MRAPWSVVIKNGPRSCLALYQLTLSQLNPAIELIVRVHRQSQHSTLERAAEPSSDFECGGGDTLRQSSIEPRSLLFTQDPDGIAVTLNDDELRLATPRKHIPRTGCFTAGALRENSTGVRLGSHVEVNSPDG